MSILKKLSSSLNRRDQVPNQELAKQIAAKNDKKAIVELVSNLKNKNKTIQGDCIKTIYEIGVIKPQLISSYTKDFIELLGSKNNRLQWGAMIALSEITDENPAMVYSALEKIIFVADNGSVITKDHFVKILIKLSGVKKFYNDTFPLLVDQLRTGFTNQLPKYAEDTLPLVNAQNKDLFIKTLVSRMRDMEVETKKKRLEKIILKAGKIQ